MKLGWIILIAAFFTMVALMAEQSLMMAQPQCHNINCILERN